MLPEDSAALLSRGEFARRSRLTLKALRVYDRVGLLRPAAVGAGNGYRYYQAGQVRTGQLIGLLRGAGLSLAEISVVLADLKQSPAAASARLETLAATLARRHADRLGLIRHVQATLREGDDPMFLIQVRQFPSLRVMSMQRRLHAPETDSFVREAKAAFAAHLGGEAPTGPFCLIFHGVVEAESDGPIEAILGCPDTVAPSEVIGIRTEPAHTEAYTTITKAQWAYPAILAAYDAVASSPQVMARRGSRLSCREVYLAEPDAIGDEDPICDVAFPLGDR